MDMQGQQTNRIFRAVADPTRRKILDRLRGQELSVGELQSGFRISQPAISRHLSVLRQARLVERTRAGRSNVYRLNAQPMKAVVDWMSHYAAFWEGKLADLGALLDETERRRK